MKKPEDDSEQTILERVSFVKVCDGDGGIIGWICEEEYFGVCVCSLQTFDSLPDALRHYLESEEK